MRCLHLVGLDTCAICRGTKQVWRCRREEERTDQHPPGTGVARALASLYETDRKEDGKQAAARYGEDRVQ